MDKKRKILFFVATLFLCVLLFLERLTGGIWHAVLGLFLIILSVVHICKRIGRLKNKKRSIQLVDWLLLALLVLLFVTGMLLHPMHGVLVIKIIHKLAAVLFLLGVIGHLVQHS